MLTGCRCCVQIVENVYMMSWSVSGVQGLKSNLGAKYQPVTQISCGSIHLYTVETDRVFCADGAHNLTFINQQKPLCRCCPTCHSKLRSTLSDPRGSSCGSWRASLIWRTPTDRCPDAPSSHLWRRTRDLWPDRSLNGLPCLPDWSPKGKQK